VKLQVLAEHEMLVKGLRSTPKSKLVYAFHSPTQSVSCYVQHGAVVHRKATIEVLKLEEFLRRARL
jgi:hypothetical protein